VSPPDFPAAPPTAPIGITRASLADGSLRRLLQAVDPKVKYLTDEERNATLAAMFPHGDPYGAPRDDVWLFAYGSLIWNPAFEFVEQRVGVVSGWRRRYCLWSPVGRGTPEFPGLMLGLEQGGSCRGAVFRIARDAAAYELDLVWRREMQSRAYIARWVKVTTTKGKIDAIAFTINPAHERYAGAMSDERTADIIAKACGQLGTCAEYLHNTVEHLRQLGARDRMLERIAALVSERIGQDV
jgi:glutathione-specific gamma-glutamylcyclotransferase